MDFFSGFKWAVPTAFADAVFQCRFEEGDVLYDSKGAYGEWGKSKEQITNSIQIRYPSKVVGSLSSNEKNVLKRNWNTEVRLDLFKNMTKVEKGQIHTTQGRLFTLLWKGNLNVLDTNTVNPEPPVIATQVKKSLIETQSKALEFAEGSLSFTMVYDQASPLLRGKLSKLTQHFGCQPMHVTPKEAGLKNWNTVSPTIEILFFKANNLSELEFHNKIKQPLYKPTISKKTNKENFRISDHGFSNYNP